MTAVLYDELGPRGRRKVRLASWAAYAGIALLLLVVLRRLESKGQLEGARWETLTNPDLLTFLAEALWNNIRAALTGFVLATVFGLLFAMGRMSRNRLVRWASGLVVELFRALPQLLIILAAALLLPRYGYELDSFVYLVVGLTLYQGSVLAEIFRAGILSLDRGQGEAAYSVGLTYSQAMAYVLVPQAVRRMLPSLVSQFVTLFKDTSLGFVIGYEEMLRRGKYATTEFPLSLMQIYLLVAVVFILINLALSRTARWLETRQHHRYGGAAVAVAGVEDLAVLDVETRDR